MNQSILYRMIRKVAIIIAIITGLNPVFRALEAQLSLENPVHGITWPSSLMEARTRAATAWCSQHWNEMLNMRSDSG